MGVLRIVGGALSGRRFSVKVGAGTRPTSDRAREAIASVIDARGGFEGHRVLDLFAGTGAMAFEALSRGATSALLVDQGTVLRSILASASALGLGDRARAVAIDLSVPDRAARRIAELTAAGEEPFARVFVDPPYDAIALVRPLLEALAREHVFAPGALLVVEHGTRATVELGSPFEVVSRYRYGDTSVLLARWEPVPIPEDSAPSEQRSPR